MKLLVDVGNTRIKYCQLKGSVIESVCRVNHHNQYSDVLGAEWSQLEPPSKVWVSNVAGQQAFDAINRYCQRQWNIQASFVKVQKQFGDIKNCYEYIDQMGVDRWMIIVGAREIFPEGNVIIIDAGTAVNIELLNQNNHYLGGAILPGMNLMHQVLMGNTHMTEAELESSALVGAVGKSTKQCVDAGVQHGLLGAIERVAKTMRQQLNGPVNFLITGGGASWLQDKLELELVHAPDLVLLGLEKVANA